MIVAITFSLTVLLHILIYSNFSENLSNFHNEWIIHRHKTRRKVVHKNVSQGCHKVEDFIVNLNFYKIKKTFQDLFKIKKHFQDIYKNHETTLCDL